jgi:hypothetical protein
MARGLPPGRPLPMGVDEKSGAEVRTRTGWGGGEARLGWR